MCVRDSRGDPNRENNSLSQLFDVNEGIILIITVRLKGKLGSPQPISQKLLPTSIMGINVIIL